eukprot:RCo006610
MAAAYAKEGSTHSSASAPDGGLVLSLCQAAGQGDLTAVREAILLHGLGVNSGDYDRRTALHLAAAEGRMAVLAFLVEKQADVNIKDRWGNTPMDEALRGQHFAVAEYLKAVGARASTLDAQQNVSRLCQKARDGDIDALTELLKGSDISVNDADYDKRTALHLAAAEGHLEVVRFLLGQKAKVNVQDRWGNTPLDEARRSNHSEVEALLMMVGAECGSAPPSASASNSPGEGFAVAPARPIPLSL